VVLDDSEPEAPEVGAEEDAGRGPARKAFKQISAWSWSANWTAVHFHKHTAADRSLSLFVPVFSRVRPSTRSSRLLPTSPAPRAGATSLWMAACGFVSEAACPTRSRRGTSAYGPGR